MRLGTSVRGAGLQSLATQHHRVAGHARPSVRVVAPLGRAPFVGTSGRRGNLVLLREVSQHGWWAMEHGGRRYLPAATASSCPSSTIGAESLTRAISCLQATATEVLETEGATDKGIGTQGTEANGEPSNGAANGVANGVHAASKNVIHASVNGAAVNGVANGAVRVESSVSVQPAATSWAATDPRVAGHIETIAATEPWKTRESSDDEETVRLDLSAAGQNASIAKAAADAKAAAAVRANKRSAAGTPYTSPSKSKWTKIKGYSTFQVGASSRH